MAIATGEVITAADINAIVASVAAKAPASGQYTGNNTDDRQVTTGFIPKLVIITSDQANDEQFIITPDATQRRLNGGNSSFVAVTTVHGSDGFIVDKDEGSNTNAQTYNYVAFPP